MPRVAPKIVLDSMQESQLQAWVQAPSTPQSLALRARVVLRASAGEGSTADNAPSANAPAQSH